MIVNPGYEADMLRRAARACRNRQNQIVGSIEWFNWVAPHLDQLAERIDPTTGAAVLAVAEREEPSDE